MDYLKMNYVTIRGQSEMSSYYKQLVTTYKTVQYKSIASVTFLSCILALIMIVTYQMVPAVVLILAAVGAAYFKRYLYVEYEYEFDKGEINIYKIVGKLKKQKRITFNIKDVEILAVENSKHLKAINNLPKKKVKFYPVTSKGEFYSAVLRYNEERFQLKFVPDSKFIELCYKYNPKAYSKKLGAK
jgi:hypothetical protein